MSALPSDLAAGPTHVHRHTTHEHEHEFEAVPGLPEALPTGERVLWQGAPSWTLLARECFHVVGLAAYFAVLVAWCVVHGLASNEDWQSIAVATVGAVGLSTLTLGLVLLLAWLSARTTLYTITDRRVVMRIGIVLSVTYNLPFSRIGGAAIHRATAGRGDVALTLEEGTRIAYLHLWPHARPWHVARTQPSLRALDDVASVAKTLTDAWQSEQARTRTLAAITADVVPLADVRPASPARAGVPQGLHAVA